MRHSLKSKCFLYETEMVIPFAMPMYDRCCVCTDEKTGSEKASNDDEKTGNEKASNDDKKASYICQSASNACYEYSIHRIYLGQWIARDFTSR